MKLRKRLPQWSKEAKKAMIDMDMTVTDLSGKIGVSRTYVSRVINATAFAPDIAFKISNELDLKVPYSENII